MSKRDAWKERVLDPREIPPDDDLWQGDDLDACLGGVLVPPLIFGGDVMLGGRSARIIAEEGADAIFHHVRPLLSRSHTVCVNLEGPVARDSAQQLRNFSYKVAPSTCPALAKANIRVAALANNHLTDCGREGVLETLLALESAGIAAAGAGKTKAQAHTPVFVRPGRLTVGVLDYYWNRRTAATRKLPGSARATEEALIKDFGEARPRCDRLVAVFHWGLPYETAPFDQDREHARLAVELGADLVVGHHPHVIQPMELYKGVPIFYSLGNFAFGSGNSKGQGMLLGVDFDRETILLTAYPLYVKNRDPRLDYRPRLLRGESASYILSLLDAKRSVGKEFDLGEVGASLALSAAREGVLLWA